MLELDPDKRLTARDVLLHPWITKHAPGETFEISTKLMEGVQNGSISPVRVPESPGFEMSAKEGYSPDMMRLRQGDSAVNLKEKRGTRDDIFSGSIASLKFLIPSRKNLALKTDKTTSQAEFNVNDLPPFYLNGDQDLSMEDDVIDEDGPIRMPDVITEKEEESEREGDPKASRKLVSLDEEKASLPLENMRKLNTLTKKFFPKKF
eukprot:TRINITY_DN2816_c0_g3_i2.p1 TRINITY_DN2816_c0_g3~~TRINITY_DN2816_c0_g3_i2.p1  ORF type:complete len:206 (+),score=51.75 TRINITY_DN2816_c0_g3_i2:158-775(+)